MYVASWETNAISKNYTQFVNHQPLNVVKYYLKKHSACVFFLCTFFAYHKMKLLNKIIFTKQNIYQGIYKINNSSDTIQIYDIYK